MGWFGSLRDFPFAVWALEKKGLIAAYLGGLEKLNRFRNFHIRETSANALKVNLCLFPYSFITEFCLSATRCFQGK
jgi:hypothetical protein